MQKEFERMREGFYLEFRPRGDLEAFLLERVISCAWRLALITQVEAEIFNAESSYGTELKPLLKDMSCDNMIVIARYENAIEGAFTGHWQHLNKLSSTIKNR